MSAFDCGKLGTTDLFNYEIFQLVFSKKQNDIMFSFVRISKIFIQPSEELRNQKIFTLTDQRNNDELIIKIGTSLYF